MFDTFVRGIEGVRTPSHLVPILVWSIIAWIIPALAAWTMLQAVGLPLPMLAAFGGSSPMTLMAPYADILNMW